MLRIHFTPVDLARTHVSSTPDPLWETVLSLQMLRARYARQTFGTWRCRTREELREAGLAPDVSGMLFPLAPDRPYFPDFLTPAEGLLGLDAGLARLGDVPKKRLRHELGRVFGDAPPGWAVRLAEHDRPAWDALTCSIQRYFDVALAPYWDRMRSGAEARHADLQLRSRAGGVGAVLEGVWPAVRWRPPVLEVPYPVTRDLRLGGRGIVLIPSWFLWRHPVALADPSLPPVLVHPLRPLDDFLGDDPPALARGGLTQLIGATRVRMLRAIGTGACTLQLADRCGIAAPTASRHASILRDAGLIDSRRRGGSVLHTLTPLGRAFLLATGQGLSPTG